jgi:hypothetical protein
VGFAGPLGRVARSLVNHVNCYYFCVLLRGLNLLILSFLILSPR